MLRVEGYDVTAIINNSDYFDWIGVNIPEVSHWSHFQFILFN